MQARGFTLVEVLVAMGLLLAATAGGVHLLAFATRAMHIARMHAVTVLAASARLDELRSLRFEFDEDGQRLTDMSTNLAVNPARDGGSGLAPGGATTLDVSVSGFVDYLDASGAWIGDGPAPPPAAVFVRRWAIEAPDGPDLLLLHVVVRPIVNDAGGAGLGAGDTRLVSVRARVQP
jgi:prepilin-type N-terminal cleavage/methylation domain-containing protein